MFLNAAHELHEPAHGDLDELDAHRDGDVATKTTTASASTSATDVCFGRKKYRNLFRKIHSSVRLKTSSNGAASFAGIVPAKTILICS